MRPPTRLVKMFLAVLLMGGVLAACTPKKYPLEVQYRPPLPSNVLAGREVSLSVHDMRAPKAFLTATARKALKNFAGYFSLIVKHESQADDLIGAFPLASLWREVFKHKLATEGVAVAAAGEAREIAIQIELLDCTLDLVDRKWVIRMGYRTNLLKADKILAREVIQGQAERVRVISYKDAEKVMAELLTDVTNQLSVTKLFQQAGL
ncbi:MAG: hypothetical protein JSW39_06180 [Desulfobacterales bacterium]|nr:MAG: hypothetical protein JSW39_06180 [Desulfobacterales bacterium]